MVKGSTQGERIRDARRAAGLTQEGLAGDVGASLSTVQSLEQDKIRGSVDLLERIATRLGVGLDHLVSGKSPTRPRGRSTRRS